MRIPLLMVVLFAAVLALSTADAAITSASLHREGLVTELSFTLDSPAPRFHLSAHGDELWIDLDRTTLHLSALPELGRDSAPIRMLRVTTGGAHTHIVVEVVGKFDYAIIQRQREIVLRLAPARMAANLRAPLSIDHPIAQPVAILPPSRALTPSPVNPLPGNPLVMIDPGHGGYDPGTQSSSGILEKDLALSIARRLAYALKARGVRAQLTRDSDDFIP